MGKRVRASKKSQHEQIIRDYVAEFKVTEVDPDHLTEWAIDNGRMEQSDNGFFQKCKKDLTKAMRDEKIVDPQGREVRKRIAIRIKNEFKQGSLWLDAFETKPKKMRTALSQQRRGLKAGVKNHKTMVDSWNDNNKWGAHIEPFDYDFNKDLKEDDLPMEYPDDKPEGDD